MVAKTKDSLKDCFENVNFAYIHKCHANIKFIELW